MQPRQKYPKSVESEDWQGPVREGAQQSQIKE
jgi:hypothetical protein